MSIVDWTEQETISAFITYRPARTDAHWASCLITVLRDARVATGRDPATGHLLQDEMHRAGCQLGALGYMVMLDQIGECYRPANATSSSQDPDFIKALRYFASNLSNNECQALYALRCSFAHDYSLLNISPRADRTHHFILDAEPGESIPVVRLPAERWDGNLARRRKATATWVDLIALGNLAEAVYERLVQLHENRALVIALAGGREELQSRYATTTFPGVRM